MSEKGLEILRKDGALKNLKDVHLDWCKDCLIGKHRRVSFKTGRTTKTAKLELIHSDVCGPMPVQSPSGKRYFVTFIDDATRKIWLYPLRTKDQVLEKFKEFLAQVERETGRKVKTVRSDNGGEYVGEFRSFLKTQGIRHQFTTPKTPQHNGVAERMNRTIMEKVRCMLAHAKLPQTYWAEAMETACHVVNLSPCHHLDGGYPERTWTGRTCKFSHLRVFGCRAFAHVPADERSKLDSRTRECIFLGYGLDEFGYRLYDPVGRRIIRSRDVVFKEDQTIEDIGVQSKGESERTPETEEEEPSGAPARSAEEADEASEQGAADGRSDETEQEINPHTPPVRRSARISHPPERYTGVFALDAEEGEPQSFEEAMTGRMKEQWQKAMKEEMDSLEQNSTYELVGLPIGRKALKNKWVFKIKQEGPNGQPRYKARLVVKGYSQRKGVDYEEIFSPVVKMTSIRAVLALAARSDLEVEQMDVKTAFLHGRLEEEIYMEQPEGFAQTGRTGLVCRLKKSLYGLKQAPRQWYQRFDEVIREMDFKRCTEDHCVYVRSVGTDEFLALLLYVDDMLIVGKNKGLIAELKAELGKIFAMKDLGAARKILGIEISRDRPDGKIYLSQQNYVKNILRRFRMEGVRPVGAPLGAHFKLSKEDCPVTEDDRTDMDDVPYASAVGSLMYAMVCTRPDIAYAVSTVSRYMANPGRQHWAAVKWIMRYLQGTTTARLCFSRSDELLGYTDSDLAGDPDDRKSTSGYVITFAGGAIAWQSRLQKCVALSTTEAEFIAATEACKEMLWMKRFLAELGVVRAAYPIYCDNQSAICLAKNSTFHARTKHIDVRYHWIRDIVNSGELEFKDVRTDRNCADMLTKVTARRQLEMCRDLAGMVLSS